MAVSAEVFAAEAAWVKAYRNLKAIEDLAHEERLSSRVPYKPSVEELQFLKRAERRVNLGSGNAHDRQALREMDAKKAAARGRASEATLLRLAQSEEAERLAFKDLQLVLKGRQMSDDIFERHSQ